MSVTKASFKKHREDRYQLIYNDIDASGLCGITLFDILAKQWARTNDPVIDLVDTYNMQRPDIETEVIWEEQ